MKCTKCGNNEATFHYSENINGRKTEAHLCADCAREEGYESKFNDFGFSSRGFFDDVFADMLSPAGFFSEPFGGMLRPMRSIARTMGAFPEFRFAIGEPSRAEPQKEAKSKETDDSEMSTKRELAALKHSLQQAVKAEDFEKCIELRDKIRGLEARQ